MKASNVFQTRKRIVDAAIAVAAKAGFTKATTKEIARHARCSEGIIYHYFKSKHDLFLAVIKENADAFLGRLKEHLGPDGHAVEKLKRLIDFHFHYFTGQANIFQILFGKSGDATVPFSYVLKTVIVPYQGAIEGVIKAGMNAGEFRRVNAVIAASSLLGMMQINIIKLHFGIRDTDSKEIKESIKNMILKALLV
ncbi:MAG: TetR/AcrR family transcriptional regulator [Candidatus Omnitrophica bacterium]|nr:TetR/AcrR family transcriptional regulator [Candidatus Omnitrophota bacterium]